MPRYSLQALIWPLTFTDRRIRKEKFPCGAHHTVMLIFVLHRQNNTLTESGSHSCHLWQSGKYHKISVHAVSYWSYKYNIFGPIILPQHWQDEVQLVCTCRLETIWGEMYSSGLFVCVNRAREWGEENDPLLTSMQMTSDGHSITSIVSDLFLFRLLIRFHINSFLKICS